MSKTWEQQFSESLHRAYQRNQICEPIKKSPIKPPIKPQNDRDHDAKNLAHAILVLCRLAGFRLDGRLNLVDLKTGRTYK